MSAEISHLRRQPARNPLFSRHMAVCVVSPLTVELVGQLTAARNARSTYVHISLYGGKQKKADLERQHRKHLHYLSSERRCAGVG